MANKHMKRYSTSLTIREVQIKATMRYHFPTHPMGIIKNQTSTVHDVKKLEPLYFAGGNVKCCSHLGKLWQFLKMLIIKVQLPYDPAIALLSGNKEGCP